MVCLVRYRSILEYNQRGGQDTLMEDNQTIIAAASSTIWALMANGYCVHDL